MPRHNRRRTDPDPVRRSSVSERREEWRGEQFVVRSISGAAAVKDYRCPGCDHEIRTGSAHVVAWPAHDPEAADRRHWHAGCWAARDHRRPTRRWS